MVQFRPAAERGQYDPPVVEDFSQAMSVDMQRRIALQQNANQQTERALQQEVENAKYTTQNDAALKSLAQFSKTAAKYVEDNAKQTVKDIQDGQDWDFMFGADNPATNLAEEVASEAADMQLSQTKATANQLDQQFGTPVGNAFYKRNAGIGKGLQNERALLTIDTLLSLWNLGLVKHLSLLLVLLKQQLNGLNLLMLQLLVLYSSKHATNSLKRMVCSLQPKGTLLST